MSTLKSAWIEEFQKSVDTLRVYKDGRLIFCSAKDRLTPLIDFLNDFSPAKAQACFLDRVVGNAAALLLTRAGCSEVYSEIGSNLAEDTLTKAGIRYRFKLTVPFIINQRGDDMCPMEKKSLGKTAEGFWQELQPGS